MRSLLFVDWQKPSKPDCREFYNEAVAAGDWLLDKGPRGFSEICRIGNWGKDGKKEAVIRALQTSAELDNIGFFCHGWPDKISLGFALDDVPELARAIAGATRVDKNIRIALYSCSTGRGRFWTARNRNTDDRQERIVTGREGFAMLLCAELAKCGVSAVVVAHLVPGHTTCNKEKVVIFQRMGFIHRVRACHPRDKGRKEWMRLLDNRNKTAFRFSAGFEMTGKYEGE